MDICKAPTRRLKMLKKHVNIPYVMNIKMENVIRNLTNSERIMYTSTRVQT